MNRFVRYRNSKYSGSGLGLAIIAQILSMQNLSYGVSNRTDGVVFYYSDNPQSFKRVILFTKNKIQKIL